MWPIIAKENVVNIVFPPNSQVFFYNGGNTEKGFANWSLCYLFRCNWEKKKTGYIFGKSSFDFSAIIRSCLDVNASSYSDTSELSICKSCYRLLIKFKRHLITLKSLNRNWRESTHEECKIPRTKRLLGEDNDGKTAEACPGKAAKCL